MQLLLGITAVILGGLAGWFYWQQDRETAFVLTAFSVSAGFLSYRFQLKRRIAAADAARKPSPDKTV